MKKILGLLSISLFFGSVFAITFKGDDIVNITEPLDEMTVIGGNSVQINAPIDGDLFIGGRNIQVNADITEDAWIAGDILNINGSIQDDLRAAGNDINVTGEVNGDVMLGGNTVTIKASVGGDAHIGTTVLSLDSSIAGDLYFGGEKILIGSGANVAGDAQISNGTEIVGNLTGAVSGNITYVDGEDHEFGWDDKGDDDDKRGGFHFNFFRFLTMCLLGALGLWAMPNYISKASKMIQSSWVKTLLYGLAILILVPIIALILLATGVGAPLGGFLMANYIFLRIFLGVFAVIFFADMIVDKRLGKHIGTSIRAKIGVMIVLSFLLTLLPYIATFILGLFGIGAGYLNDMKIIKKNR